ncbi:glyoxylate reductase/hydroxypyruvate reductase-like [Hydractinia symbiolongicarpus]|uniref:glyoxylate reductase/hydroxypyruvate reductase-like n=1 Tax=Hydractinia symbiolongicarpus TaxID=13093 RepID=UPI002551C30A|nr:glyoxylate reductase/hydroxypyruvate reductase-like [Hydractinia symbiolongicarpus]
MSTVKKIFVWKKLIKPAMDILHDSGYEIKIWQGENDPTEEELIQNVKDIHGIYSFGPQKITKCVIDAAKQLEVVSAMSVGVDSIDIGELKARNIKLGHTPDVLTDAVADIAVSLVLTVSRRIIEMADTAKFGEWKTWCPFSNLGTGLRGSTVGIVGLGRIGTATAKRLVPFGVSRFVYTCRSEKQEAARTINASYVSFDDLLSQSDFVIVCCSMNPTTQELFDKDAFSKMKSNSILVNIGRGGMVNQDALVDALTEKKIKGAGLDVTTPEPLPVEHPLFKLKNCVILPHIGSAEEQTRTDMTVLAARNLSSSSSITSGFGGTPRSSYFSRFNFFRSLRRGLPSLSASGPTRLPTKKRTTKV